MPDALMTCPVCRRPWLTASQEHRACLDRARRDYVELRREFDDATDRWEALALEFKRERDEARGIADDLVAALGPVLTFDLAPTFDAKGTYTERKAREWAGLRATLQGHLARAATAWERKA